MGETVGRSIALLAGVLIVLLIIFGPAHALFHTALDVGVYQDYARGALAEPMSLPCEYPPLAAGIFVLPHLLSADHYLLGFALLAALAAWLTILAVDRLSGGGWWLLCYLALGAWGTLFFRYDIVVVLLTVLAFASATRRHWLLSQVLLAVAVALKLYPLILMPLVVLWQWQTKRRLPVSSTFGGVLSLAITTGSMWLIAPAQVGGMVSYRADRPLEIESTGASLAWLLGPTAIDRSIGSVNLISTLSLTLIIASTEATLVLLLTLYGYAFKGRLERAVAWALALTIAIVTSKVFSTQYLLWPLPFIVLAGGKATATQNRLWLTSHHALWALICVLTSLIYPVTLWLFMTSHSHNLDWLMGLVTLRNALLLLACGLLLRKPGQMRHHPTAASHGADHPSRVSMNLSK